MRLTDEQTKIVKERVRDYWSNHRIGRPIGLGDMHTDVFLAIRMVLLELTHAETRAEATRIAQELLEEF